MSGLWEIIEQVLRLDFSGLYEFSPLAIFFIILFTTFITEDGACLAAGALAGQGRISFALALSACFAGIFIGDIGLYWIGRLFGRSISRTRVFRRVVSEKRLNSATMWLEDRGPMAIVISRFVAGLRLPTYLAAGFLRAKFSTFVFYFFIATAIWTPILVGSATFAQQIISPQYLLLSILSLFLLFKLVFNISTWKKRRLMIGKLKRLRNWEFWPLPVFYFPVFLYVLYLGLRHRSLTLFTCANPAILAGGFIGETKSEIYEGLNGSAPAKPFLLRHELIPEALSIAERISSFHEFMKIYKLEFPVIVKPDVGERGKDVVVADSINDVEMVLGEAESDQILQEYAGGEEVSVFYFRYPSKPAGQIFSITKKSFPVVYGDGKSTLEELILTDRRAVSLAEKYFEQNEERLEIVPKQGEEVRLIDIGTHSRGAVFGEGGHLETDELVSVIDEICGGFDGFYFGRFDIRMSSIDTFKRGTGFKIVELNGVTSESTNIYDKKYTLFDAYEILFRQWRIAFEIGAENRENGVESNSFSDLVRLMRGKEISGPKKDKTVEICA